MEICQTKIVGISVGKTPHAHSRIWRRGEHFFIHLKHCCKLFDTKWFFSPKLLYMLKTKVKLTRILSKKWKDTFGNFVGMLGSVFT